MPQHHFKDNRDRGAASSHRNRRRVRDSHRQNFDNRASGNSRGNMTRQRGGRRGGAPGNTNRRGKENIPNGNAYSSLTGLLLPDKGERDFNTIVESLYSEQGRSVDEITNTLMKDWRKVIEPPTKRNDGVYIHNLVKQHLMSINLIDHHGNDFPEIEPQLMPEIARLRKENCNAWEILEDLRVNPLLEGLSCNLFFLEDYYAALRIARFIKTSPSWKWRGWLDQTANNMHLRSWRAELALSEPTSANTAMEIDEPFSNFSGVNRNRNTSWHTGNECMQQPLHQRTFGHPGVATGYGALDVVKHISGPIPGINQPNNMVTYAAPSKDQTWNHWQSSHCSHAHSGFAQPAGARSQGMSMQRCYQCEASSNAGLNVGPYEYARQTYHSTCSNATLRTQAQTASSCCAPTNAFEYTGPHHGQYSHTIPGQMTGYMNPQQVFPNALNYSQAMPQPGPSLIPQHTPWQPTAPSIASPTEIIQAILHLKTLTESLANQIIEMKATLENIWVIYNKLMFSHPQPVPHPHSGQNVMLPADVTQIIMQLSVSLDEQADHIMKMKVALEYLYSVYKPFLSSTTNQSSLVLQQPGQQQPGQQQPGQQQQQSVQYTLSCSDAVQCILELKIFNENQTSQILQSQAAMEHLYSVYKGLVAQ